jgi:antitoxin VapB
LEGALPKSAKLFKSGGSQAVRLPKEFRFPGKEVFIEKRGNLVILRPKVKPVNWDEFFSRPSRVPKDFLADRKDLPLQKRKLF